MECFKNNANSHNYGDEKAPEGYGAHDFDGPAKTLQKWMSWICFLVVPASHDGTDQELSQSRQKHQRPALTFAYQSNPKRKKITKYRFLSFQTIQANGVAFPNGITSPDEKRYRTMVIHMAMKPICSRIIKKGMK